jgi:ATP synthase protein I
MAYQRPISDEKLRNKAAGGLQSLVQAEKLMQVAFVLPSAMVIGWLAGAWADTKLHQSWLTIAGVIFGCVAGLYYVVRLAMDAEKGVGPLNDPDKKGSGKGEAQ